MKTIREQIEVMKAFERGEKIQSNFKLKELEYWEDNTNPVWDWHFYDYRIKPQTEPEEIFSKGDTVVWLHGNEYSVYEVVKVCEELYILSDLMGRQIEINPQVAKAGGYKDAKDDSFLWYFEVLKENEVQIYPKKLTYKQMIEVCKSDGMSLIKPLYSLGFTYNSNREDFKR